ncbi:hypothetical protein ACB094_03G054200 [Castanea mollissima]
MAGSGYAYRGYSTYSGVPPSSDEWSKSSYASDTDQYLCQPVIVDAEQRKLAIILAAPNYVAQGYVTTVQAVVEHPVPLVTGPKVGEDYRYKHCSPPMDEPVKDNGYKVEPWKDYGYKNSFPTKAEPMKDSGYKVEPVKDYKYKTEPVKGYGYKPEPVRDYGYTAEPVKDYGHAAEPVKDYGYKVEPTKDYRNKAEPIKDYGYKTEPIKDSGYKVEPTKDYRNKTEPIKDYGYKTEPIKDSGYKVEPVKDYKYKTEPVKGYGYKFERMRDYGYTAEPVKDYGYPAEPVKDYGYKIEPTKDYGKRAEPIKDYGYKTEPIRDYRYKTEPMKEYGKVEPMNDHKYANDKWHRPSSPIHDRPQEVENPRHEINDDYLHKNENAMEPTTINTGGWVRPNRATWSTPPPSHQDDATLSKPTSDLGTAVENLKEALKPLSVSSPTPRFSVPLMSKTVPKKDAYTETINSREAARRYSNLTNLPPAEDKYTKTIDSREAARKYGGAII